jgi:hypothetical protein
MEKNMNLKYRLIYADTGIPCSDWSDDAEHFLRYLANRPDWVRKIIVVDEKGNVVSPEPDGIRVSLTDTADALEKLNADKPNDVRDDIFITKSEA